MRMGMRLAFWLIAGVTCVSLLFAVYQVEVEYQGRRHELKRRAELLAGSLQGTVAQFQGDGSLAELQRIVERFGERERLVGIAIYDRDGAPIVMTDHLADKLEGRQSARWNRRRFAARKRENFSGRKACRSMCTPPPYAPLPG